MDQPTQNSFRSQAPRCAFCGGTIDPMDDFRVIRLSMFHEDCVGRMDQEMTREQIRMDAYDEALHS